MALLNYKKFKVTVDGDSPKVNGLKYGDVVLRQYNDGAVSLYSIMYVIETGTTDVVINGVTKKEKWFIGALLEGDEPSSGENLDFSRITSISDEDRMGAIYMTSISSDAPYIDTIDSIGKDESINYPNSFGSPLIYNKSSFSFIGEEYFSSSYLKYNGNEKRIFKLTKNSTPIIVGEKVAISIPTLKGKYSDEKILVTYKYRASGNFICNTEVSDSNGNYILMSKQITTSTEVKSNVDIFSVSNINDDSSFKIDLSQISTSGAWIEISDINIIPIFSLSRWYNSVKNRLGKLTGITDSIFGELKDYGGYFQRLYATKDINIAGTLTAGDANGFGSTFYAGKIHKNIFINSLSHDLGVYGKIDNSQGIPTGIGNSFILSDRSSHESHHIITYNTPEWYNSNAGKKYTFSAWIKSASGIKSVTLTENGNEPLSIQVDETWMRYSYTFAIGSDTSNSYCFIDIFGADTNTGLYICGMQVELGEYASPYQPTDDTLAIGNEDYGVWMTRGGIGGTIQNPLLQFTPEGDIRSKNDKFYITNDGTAYFEGSITAASGKIADWIIATNSLYRGVEKNILNSYTGAAGDITIGSNGIRGYKWMFDSDGSGALAGGKISFDADGTAKIGLWNIDENSIFSGIKQSSNDYTSSGITIHSDGAIRAKYARIDTDGKLYASSADIAGKITATLGQIGGWNINDTSITGGNTIINSNGSITNGTHWALNYDGSASFADGKIAFSSAGIGSIGGFTIGSDIIYSGESDYALGNISMQRTLDGGKFIASKDGNNYVMLYRNSDTDWGVLGALAGTNVFQLGSTNKISGWNFDSNALYTGTKALNDASNTTIANSITFWSSGAISSLNFRLGVDGKIYATNADISGKITASSGQIGAWNVDTNSIFSGTKSINDASNTTVDGSTTFWSSGAITSRYFRVGTDGKLYATSVDLQGKIVAASGSIGGWTINADSISGGSTHINSNGSITNGTLWILNADGSSSFAGGKINFTSTGEGFIGGWKINSNSIFSGTKALNDASFSTAINSMTIWSSGAISALNFRVGTDGKLYALDADISGKVTATSGKIGLWNIGNSLFTGTENNESGQFTPSVGGITLGSNGIRGYKWRFESDGSGAIAGGNIYWDAAGLLTISGNASTASQLKVAVELWGNSFNGAEPIYGPLLIKNTVDTSKSVTLSVDIDGNLKIDGNMYATGEVSAYGAGSGSGGGSGSGIIETVYGSAGLGGSYLDSDYTNTFNAYTINLINTNLTGALGRIGALETSTPNISWGTATGQYSPLTINSVTRNLSLDGHTHSYLPLSGGTLTGNLSFSQPVGIYLANGQSIRDNGGGGMLIYSDYAITLNSQTLTSNGNPIWHAGNDGAGSGLDADLLDGLHNTSFLRCDSISANDNKNAHYAIGTDSTHNFIQSHASKPLYLNELGNAVYINNVLAATVNSNVASATKLQNTRTIWGQSFNGEGNVSGAITGATTGEFSESIKAPVLRHTNSTWIVGYDGINTTSLGSAAFPNIVKLNNNAGAVTLFGSGNVAVGEFNASDYGYKLDVNGAIRSNYVLFKNYNDNGLAGYVGRGSSSSNKILLNGYAGNSVYVGANNNDVDGITINTSNYVGIGTTSPSYKLDINGIFRSTDRGYINGDLYVGSASVDRTILTRIISSHDSGLLSLNPWGGNVVIGAPNAIEKLYVNGSTKINGYFRVSNDTISAGEYEDNGYGFINVCRTASIENASYFSMVRAGTGAFGIGLSTDNSIIIGGAAPDKTINNIHLKLHSDYVTTSKALSSSSRISTGYDSWVPNSISCSNWFRSNGESGWFNDSKGAGIYSDTSNVVRTYGANKFRVYNTDYDSINTLGGVCADYWFRSNGNSGWYNQTYDGGIYMTDTTYVRVYHNKSFWVDGNIVATGEVTAYSASDIRLKTNIKPIISAIDVINKLNPVSYNWNEKAKELNPLKGDSTEYGLIAQELEEVLPELVHPIYDGEYKSVDYVKIVPLLIGAIKELQLEINELKNK